MHKVMKKYLRLASITACGVTAMILLAVALYAVEDVLASRGHQVSNEMFLIVALFLLLGVFGITANVAMREIRRLNERRL
jgi:uncharacterized membrane protein